MLAGKYAIVTGGSAGIGAAITEALVSVFVPSSSGVMILSYRRLGELLAVAVVSCALDTCCHR